MISKKIINQSAREKLSKELRSKQQTVLVRATIGSKLLLKDFYNNEDFL